MTITVKHAFVSAKGDGSDATLVRPSNWNENHDIEMATNRVLGRLTAGPGDVEELPVTSYMMALLNTADYATLAIALGLPTTGDARLTYKSTADSGWILANDGTIGDVGSGATRANLDTQALFTFFYNGFSDAVCPVQTSRAGLGDDGVRQRQVSHGHPQELGPRVAYWRQWFRANRAHAGYGWRCGDASDYIR
jgi:hypothetical protein